MVAVVCRWPFETRNRSGCRALQVHQASKCNDMTILSITNVACDINQTNPIRFLEVHMAVLQSEFERWAEREPAVRTSWLEH